MSGIIESYVLGLASKEEQAEFEQMCLQYPEVADARNRFEIALEQQLLGDAESKNLAAGVKDRVMEAIRQQSSETQTKVITMQNSNTRSNSSPLRWVAAASIILLLGASFFAYKFYNQSRELSESNAELMAKQKVTDSLVQQMYEEQKIINDPNVAVVNMTGTESSASVYWDSTSSNVYLVVKNMPKLPSDKQYQLWALIDGEPKNLGLFDVGDNKKFFLKMNNTQKADAFAITIETRGNKGGPNLEQLQNMGKTPL